MSNEHEKYILRKKQLGKLEAQGLLGPATCSTKYAAEYELNSKWWRSGHDQFDTAIDAENYIISLGAKVFRIIQITTSERIL
jgi:hypothetical protein